MSDINRFTIDLDKAFKKEVLDNIPKMTRKVGMMVFSGVVNGSPVDTGRFRASWMATIGAATDEVADEKDRGSRGPGGEAEANATRESMARANAAFTPDNVTGKDELHICNNLPYADYLVHGSSFQAADGWIDEVIEEVKRKAPGGKRGA